MTKKIIYTLLFALACTAGAINAAAQSEPSAQANNLIAAAIDKSGYRLGVGDEVEVRVLGEKDFDGKYTVDEDGRIQMPFVEAPIPAMCKTDRELRGEITTLLKKYLREPQVSVQITEKRSRPPAVVYGEVRQPQQFDMRRNVTLLELYSYTGGVTEQANGTIQVFHTKSLQCVEPGADATAETAVQNTNDPVGLPFETYKLSELRDGRVGSNPVVRPGDVIIFQKTAPVYVVGEVRSPQGVYIPERGLTLTDAMAMVGGLNDRAKKKDVRVYRVKSGSSEREMISANLDLIKKGQQNNIVLQPYDIVEVEKAPKSVFQVVKEVAMGAVQTAGAGLGNAPLRVIY